jgi:hypothetical protein
MIQDIKLIDGYADMTAANIATALNAIPTTKSKIPLDDLLFLLNNRGMLVRLIWPASEMIERHVVRVWEWFKLKTRSDK